MLEYTFKCPRQISLSCVGKCASGISRIRFYIENLLKAIFGALLECFQLKHRFQMGMLETVGYYADQKMTFLQLQQCWYGWDLAFQLWVTDSGFSLEFIADVKL